MNDSLPEALRTDPTASKRSVLVISFRFPPHGGGGVQRTAYFVKHLVSNGWEPHVLTGPGGVRKLQDRSLLEVIPSDMPVTRTGMVNTDGAFRFLGHLRLARMTRLVTLTLPNMTAGWIPHALRTGLKLLERNDYHLIYSSAYPIASHVVAYMLKKRSGLPWVADYRDEWSTRAILRWPSPLHQRLAHRVDRMLMASADRVVTTSPLASEVFARTFPSPDPSKFVMITNGYDPEDFRGRKSNMQAEPGSPTRKEGRGRFRIAHVGSVFAWQRPELFLQAVERLIDRGSIPAEQVEILFVGNTCDLSSSRLEEAGALRKIEYVDHATAIATMTSADLLLLINGESVSIPGKAFEYLAAGRPILAVLPAGPAADIIEAARGGRVVEPRIDQIADAVQSLFRSWRDGSLGCGADVSAIGHYTRSRITRQLADVFNETLEQSLRREAAGDRFAPSGRPTQRPRVPASE